MSAPRTAQSRSVACRRVGLAASPGCLVGPNYEKPTLPTPDAIRGAEPSPTGPSLGDAKWWEVFQDEQLQALVKTALAQNDDLRIAAARVLEAEAQLGITRADQYPTVGVEVQAGGGRTRADRIDAGADRRRRCGSAASVDWELDFWGTVPPRHRVGARAAAGDRVGPARGAHDDRQRGGRLRTSGCGRSICSSRSRSGR